MRPVRATVRRVSADDALPDEALAALLDAHAPMRACALVPAVRAWHAEDEIPLWQALEAALGGPIGAPFFCVPWPGALALARAVFDDVVDVRGKLVADVGCGSGVAALAALDKGAARVVAVDVDPLAAKSARILAARHGVEPTRIHAVAGDALANPAVVATVDAADVVLAGDLVSAAAHAAPFRAALARWGTRAVLADSGRPFFDAGGRRVVAAHDVDVPRSLEGAARRTVRVYR